MVGQLVSTNVNLSSAGEKDGRVVHAPSESAHVPLRPRAHPLPPTPHTPINANIVLEPPDGPAPHFHLTQLKMKRFTWVLPVTCVEFYTIKKF